GPDRQGDLDRGPQADRGADRAAVRAVPRGPGHAALDQGSEQARRARLPGGARRGGRTESIGGGGPVSELDPTDDLDLELGLDDGSAGASAPLVAIIGRPNVGKSTLFNRLVGRREAIVEDKPGVTRDRLYGVGSWEGRHFLVVDTGGVDPSLDTGLPKHIQSQAEIAIEEADLILFVVDAAEGVTAVDLELADLLRRSGKPVLVAANKVDSDKRELDAQAFHELGLGKVHPVSAAHGRNVGEFCDAV